MRRGLIWPQQLKVVIGYRDGVRTSPVSVTARTTDVSAARNGNPPLYVLPNGEGLGYGLFALDAGTRRYLLDHLEEIHDPLTRGSAWVDLWEELLAAAIAPAEFLNLITRALPLEDDEQNTQLVLSEFTRARFGYSCRTLNAQSERRPSKHFCARASRAPKQPARRPPCSPHFEIPG